MVALTGPLRSHDPTGATTPSGPPVRRSKAVDGVKGVENLLHLPGTEAPNKEAAREAS